MPIQRGKKRKRTRRHAGREDGHEASVAATTPPAAPAKPRPSIWRRGKQAPPIVNLIFGVMMLILGVVFFVSGLGSHGGSNFVLLLLYMLVAGFYLSRAFRQYRGKRQT